MEASKNVEKVSSVHVTDDVAALPERHWFVAYTRVNYERRGAAILQGQGLECWVPVQHEVHQWSDRRKRVERVVTPMMIFIHCEAKRLRDVVRLSFVSHMLVAPGQRTPAIIPDDQVERFRFLLENAPSEVTLTSGSLRCGDAVRVRSGALAGLTGTVVKADGTSAKVGIALDFLGFATVSVDISDLERA